MPTLMVQHHRLGLVDKDVYALDAAAHEYDERLLLDRHPETGDWVVYIRMEPPTRPYPVLGLGKALPSVSDLLVRLRKADTMYNDVRQQVNDGNAALRADKDRKAAENVTGAADVSEYLLRKQGHHTGPSYRKVVKN